MNSKAEKGKVPTGKRTRFGLESEEGARGILGEFARAFCIDPRTLQEWEQGRRKPDATTRAYLAVIEKNRQAVLDVLAS